MKNNKTKITVEPDKQKIDIIREFDAPREVVFKAFLYPKYYANWLNSQSLTVTLAPFKPGRDRRWQYIHKYQDIAVYAFHDVCLKIMGPERIINSFTLEWLPKNELVTLESAKFESLPGERTKLIAQAAYHSDAKQDDDIQYGVERSINEGFNRLDKLLEKIQKETLN